MFVMQQGQDSAIVFTIRNQGYNGAIRNGLINEHIQSYMLVSVIQERCP